MFEPIHGSAPKYAGKNVANPIASIWTAQMMLEELGEIEGAKRVMAAIEDVLREGKIRTRDRGGSSKTTEVGDVIAEKIRNLGC
jgi:isocitrate/isopropylmalate dehydrogenase